MNDVEAYLAELAQALHTRGRRRRRLLAECRDHLTASAADVGATGALRRFGTVTGVASAFDAETAACRLTRSTFASVVGVVAVALSTLALLDGSAGGGAVAMWAVVFFGAAQTCAVATLMVVLQTAALRWSPPVPAVPSQLTLLGRRQLVALGCALLVELAAGAAVPGRGSATALLAGPLLATVALIVVLRAWWFARRLDPRHAGAVRSPVTDLGVLLGRRTGAVGASTLLLVTAAVAVPAAFVWNDLDQGTVTGSLAVAGTELGLLLLGFAVLGRTLGLRHGGRWSGPASGPGPA